ncbi:hypothetical protein C7416_102191 [Cupriavidus phytorum]|uniref:Uncharacterized protein n=1 Tax=Cupriavidus phytorum TaxID=3024399 RepID=A0A2W7P7E2_9BURK|nr:hypothetical protein C7416_102191 [Cupriavidus alkaliphilus]
MDRLDGLSFAPGTNSDHGFVTLHFGDRGDPSELCIPVPLALQLLNSLQLLTYEHGLRKLAH